MSFYFLYSIANDIVIIRKLCKKETPTQMFSCEICENFKNTYFDEHLQTTASIMGVYISANQKGESSTQPVVRLYLKVVLDSAIASTSKDFINVSWKLS